MFYEQSVNICVCSEDRITFHDQFMQKIKKLQTVLLLFLVTELI